MFCCQTCLRKCLKGTVRGSVIESVGQTTSTLSRRTVLLKRRFGTVEATTTKPHEDSQLRSFQRPFTRADKSAGIRDNEKYKSRRSAQRTEKDARNTEEHAIKRPGAFAATYRNQSRYLKDPLKLADTVREYLRDDKFDEALALTQFASKDVQCTVSWNHLINWQLTKGKVRGALKSYNEMKKRSQTPDAHTYTILFKGMADQSDLGTHPAIVGKALSIYHSMGANNSPVQPNIIHTNAVLKVCARARDLDALFGIAAKLPSKGFRAANNLTYTTIFNAIRQYASSLRLEPEELARVYAKTIIDGRRMWDDIVTQWRSGNLWIDEELVCSMGRILLLGNRGDIDDIFSLLEQTMGIPRQYPAFGNESRARIESSRQEQPDSASSDDLKVISAPQSSTEKPFAYAKPGRNTLSLIGEALLELKMKAPMSAYWNLLTQRYGVHPDSENYHAYLRVLRLARASSETVALLEVMPPRMMQLKTFRIAMAACERESDNPSAFSNGGQVLKKMQTAMSQPDLIVLHSYLNLSCKAPARSVSTGTAGGHKPKFDLGAQIEHALDEVEPFVTNIKAAATDGNASTPSEERTAAKYRFDAIGLLRKLVSAYDSLLGQQMGHRNVPREYYKRLRDRRSKIVALVDKLREKKGPSAQSEGEEEKSNIRAPPAPAAGFTLDRH